MHRETVSREDKAKLRRLAYEGRNRQADKDALSRRIVATLTAQPEYARARTVMWYLGIRSEVRTRPAVEEALASGRRIVVPYCTVDASGAGRLGLWHLGSLEELTPGTWNIPEPPRGRWGEPEKEVSPRELDLVVVPGVAFDRRGARLGNGRGYYDRLLAEVRPDAALLAPAFECQIFDEVVVGPDDVFVDKVITERNVYARGAEQA